MKDIGLQMFPAVHAQEATTDLVPPFPFAVLHSSLSQGVGYTSTNWLPKPRPSPTEGTLDTQDIRLMLPAVYAHITTPSLLPLF